MAKTPLDKLYSILGTVIWGDLADMTMYRNRKGRVVAFAKTWPKDPASTLQLQQRAKMTAAAAAWKALTGDERANWELATKRASLCMHGYDLFVHWQLINDATAIATLERQTNTTLLP